jgi:hypothetical protein
MSSVIIVQLLTYLSERKKIFKAKFVVKINSIFHVQHILSVHHINFETKTMIWIFLKKNSSKVASVYDYWDKNHLPVVCSLVRRDFHQRSSENLDFQS